MNWIATVFGEDMVFFLWKLMLNSMMDLMVNNYFNECSFKVFLFYFRNYMKNKFFNLIEQCQQQCFAHCCKLLFLNFVLINKSNPLKTVIFKNKTLNILLYIIRLLNYIKSNIKQSLKFSLYFNKYNKIQDRFS